MERPRRTTIDSVAKLAGVSLASVSRVMNGNASVDPEIARRVRMAAAELNYTASPLARSLVLGTTKTIACLVPDLANPTFQGIIRGLSRSASRDGYRVLIADSAEDAAGEADTARELRRRCDAIVLCAPRMTESTLMPLLRELGPVVVINREITADASVLMADYESGVRLLAEHLYDLGHRRLAYLAGNPSSASNTSREVGLRGFADAHPDVDIVTIPTGVTFEDGYAALEDLPRGTVTAVLAYNDLVAMGLLGALSEAGIDVPTQLSVTGFDDIPFARYTSPPLTTASVPVVEMGEQAWQRVQAVLGGADPWHAVSFRPRLEARGSTAPPPAHSLATSRA